MFNKCELNQELFDKIKNEYQNSGVEVIRVSCKENINLDELIKILKNNTTTLAGQSGVGKTSLLNKICEKENKIGNLSEKTKRGKNTTTSAELINLEENSFILDTAGFSKIEFNNLDPSLIKSYYKEFENTNCVYSNCNHVFEGNKCSVINSKDINPNRYDRYKQIFLECKENWSKRYD